VSLNNIAQIFRPTFRGLPKLAPLPYGRPNSMT
jgi:hypothetical protein